MSAGNRDNRSELDVALSDVVAWIKAEAANADKPVKDQVPIPNPTPLDVEWARQFWSKS